MEQKQTATEKQQLTNTTPLGKRLAKVVSDITNPLFIALPTFLIIALATAPDIFHALLWWITAVLGISIAPLIFIWQGVRRGRYTDHHVSKREQRLVPLIFGLTCMVLAFILLLTFHASTHLIATATATIAAVAIATIITQYWKISLHLVGMAGAVTCFSLIWGPIFLSLSPLVLLVGWARWEMKAHTLLQAVAGTILAVSVTILIYYLFGIA